MNLTLLLVGIAMIVVGGFIVWRFRKSKFNSNLPAGCAMSLGVILLIVGICCVPFALNG